MNRIILSPDDMPDAKYICIHSTKNDEETPQPLYGQAFELKLVELPFVLCRIPGRSNIVTLDTRFFNLMKVSEEYYKLQAGIDAPQPQAGPKMNAIFGLTT